MTDIDTTCRMCGSTFGPRVELAGSWVCLEHVANLGAGPAYQPRRAIPRRDRNGRQWLTDRNHDDRIDTILEVLRGGG